MARTRFAEQRHRSSTGRPAICGLSKFFLATARSRIRCVILGSTWKTHSHLPKTPKSEPAGARVRVEPDTGAGTFLTFAIETLDGKFAPGRTYCGCPADTRRNKAWPLAARPLSGEGRHSCRKRLAFKRQLSTRRGRSAPIRLRSSYHKLPSRAARTDNQPGK